MEDEAIRKEAPTESMATCTGIGFFFPELSSVALKSIKHLITRLDFMCSSVKT